MKLALKGFGGDGDIDTIKVVNQNAGSQKTGNSPAYMSNSLLHRKTSSVFVPHFFSSAFSGRFFRVTSSCPILLFISFSFQSGEESILSLFRISTKRYKKRCPDVTCDCAIV